MLAARLSPQEQLNIYEEEYLQGFKLMEIGKGSEAEVIFTDLISCLSDLPERSELLLLRARAGLAFRLYLALALVGFVRLARPQIRHCTR